MPVSFHPNVGQADESADFVARGRGYTLTLGSARAVLSTAQGTVGMDVVGADPAVRGEGVNRLPGQVNYLNGPDPAGWHRHLPSYARVRYSEVYPGVELAFHGDQGELEYDFVVAPGVDPGAIRLRFSGIEGLTVDDAGDLVLHTTRGDLRQGAPRLYQDVGAERRPVAGRFALNGHEVGFAVGDYDRTRPLVVDPTIVSSTFLGGAGEDFGISVAVDSAGYAYIAGATTSPDFPTTPGAHDTSHNGDQDGFVTKLAPDGSTVIYSTFLGGAALDDADTVAVGGRGDAYVRGVTVSPDFPTTPGAFDRTFNGGFDAWVARLSADGSSLRYSTFLGGSNFDSGSGIAVDRTGAAYVGGITGSPEFPTTPGAYDRTFEGVGGPLPPPVAFGDFDGYLIKLVPDGSRLEYSTFFGGSSIEAGFELAVDARGEAYVAGITLSPDFPTTARAFDRTLGGFADGFVTKFNRDGSALVYSTLVGGSGLEGVLGLAVDLRGSAYVTGGTPSPDFPTTAGSFDTTFNGGGDAFVTKLTRDGSGLEYSSFLGGSATDGGNGIAVDVLGRATVTGGTRSSDFPTTAGAFDTTPNGDIDAFLSTLAPNGSQLVSSTYLGGTGFDSGLGVAVDRRGAASVTGETDSTDFPTTPGAFDRTLNGELDAFLVKASSAGRLGP
ncbi:MAG TPA: SBBP repeat-containing protein [Acidimicrobiales bacterium]|nr:SBBP repeat-containing protein [Acidimicrobiales bacterium]